RQRAARMAHVSERAAAVHAPVHGLMVSGAPSQAFVARSYPERDDQPAGRLERLLTELRYLSRNVESGKRHLSDIVDAVARHGRDVVDASDEELKARAASLRPQLKRAGFDDLVLAGEAFALVREISGRVLGMRHFDVQLIGGWAMLRGMIAEMNTGEGK